MKYARKLPFFAELPDRKLIQVVGRKTDRYQSEDGDEKAVECTAYEILGTGEVQWRRNLKYIRISRDIIERDFPEYVI